MHMGFSSISCNLAIFKMNLAHNMFYWLLCEENILLIFKTELSHKNVSFWSLLKNNLDYCAPLNSYYWMTVISWIHGASIQGQDSPFAVIFTTPKYSPVLTQSISWELPVFSPYNLTLPKNILEKKNTIKIRIQKLEFFSSWKYIEKHFLTW